MTASTTAAMPLPIWVKPVISRSSQRGWPPRTLKNRKVQLSNCWPADQSSESASRPKPKIMLARSALACRPIQKNSRTKGGSQTRKRARPIASPTSQSKRAIQTHPPSQAPPDPRLLRFRQTHFIRLLHSVSASIIASESGSASGAGLPTITVRTCRRTSIRTRPFAQRVPIRHDRHGRLGVNLHPARVVVLNAWVFHLPWTYPVENIAQQFQLG